MGAGGAGQSDAAGGHLRPSVTGAKRRRVVPARQPEHLRYSIEALGGDVEGCLRRYFHMPILWGRDGKAPEYLVLVGGLLVK